MHFDPSFDVVNRVVEALKENPQTEKARIDVAHERGVVSLRGTVRSNAQRELAEEIARQQDGVITVINEISVV